MHKGNTAIDEFHRYNLGDQKLELATEEEDIGIILDKDISFDKHIADYIMKANSMFDIIRRYLDIQELRPSHHHTNLS